MKTFITSYLIFCCFFVSCSFLEQRDFIKRETLITNEGENVFYDIFQTGVDNFDFVFYSSYNSDTSKLLNYYVNDAVYTALQLGSRIENDTLIIETNMPTEEQRGITVAGRPYCLKRKQTAHNSSFKK